MTDHRNSATPIDPAKLDRLAEVAVKVGLGLRPGQDLLLTAPAIALPLVRRIAVHAYKAGAGIVTPILSDEEMTLARYRHGHDNSFDRAAGWLYEGMAKAFSDNTARLAIVGDNPMLLSGEDPRQGRARQQGQFDGLSAGAGKDRQFRHQLEHHRLSEPVLGEAGVPWRLRGGRGRQTRGCDLRRLRVDREDAIANWANHNAVLRERTNWLNAKRFRALQYTGPGTDLTIGLADGHEWEGGASLSKNGISCNANIPTEEVFTTPHCRRVYGHVVSSKPLSYQGTLIDNIAVRFEDGKIVDAKASRGEEVLNKVLDTDEGARRLGEVALVPHSSPISQSGLLFFNTLFDENAASHIALGQCYSKCFVNGAQLTPQQIAAQGGNQSLIHIDWMIGSAETDIDGILADGSKVPVFRKGEWAK